MTPRFNRKKYGYDSRQVDDYIDKLHAENQRLSRVNDEMYLLYLTELRQLAQQGVRIPEKGSGYGELSLSKINALLEQSMQRRTQLQPTDTPPQEAAEQPPEKPSRLKRSITGSIFYVGLALAVLAVYLFSTGDPTGPPRNILGFSFMTVLTRSMQDEIPQDSLIITRRVDAETIRVGDDITFLAPNDTTITHRVIDVRQNYRDTGLPGFETQGIMNSQPDPEIVLAADLVGRVIFSSLALGSAVLFIRSNVLIIGVLAAVTIVLIIGLRRLIFKDESDESASGPTGERSHRRRKRSGDADMAEFVAQA